MKTTVYVVQETDKNISPASRYGNIHVILTLKDVSHGLDHCLDKLQRRMAEIEPDDYILCIGDPVVIGLAIHIALTITDGTINVLKWNKMKYCYDKETISI